MRFSLLIFLLVCLRALAAEPEHIYPKTKVIKPVSWYAEQAQLWKSKIEAERHNASAWLNYYVAARYAQVTQSELSQLLLDLESSIPNSFEWNLVKGMQLNYAAEAFTFFKKASELNPSHTASYASLLLSYELQHDNHHRREYGEKLLGADLISKSLLNYSYNVLMSVEPGAILITEGENTTIPLFVLQDVMHVREDVVIISLDLMENELYQSQKLKDNFLQFQRLNLSENNFREQLITRLPLENPQSKFYYALTLSGENIVTIKDQLYVVGLASEFSATRIDNLSAIKENLEKRFLMDYLTVDFNGENEFAAGRVLSANYLVPMLMLHEYYVSSNESVEAKKLEQVIMKLAHETGRDMQVRNFLNRIKYDVPYFPYQLNLKAVEGTIKKISPSVYAGEFEVTNEEYNRFLSYLVEHKLNDQYERYKFELSAYEEPALSFMKGYTAAWIPTKKEKHFTQYPAVSLSFESVLAYCDWLTEQYNNQPERKFKKVKFRLPSLKEWQVAALGNPKFSTWELDDNIVKVGIPKNDTEELSKDFRDVPVRGHDIQYPWYGAYNYRNKVLNSRGCSLGNFKFPDNAKPCVPSKMTVLDGWTMMAPVGTYFPNAVGLYDVVGNVAEMIDEKGKACGGSWNHSPEQSTIRSINLYEKPDTAIGFRVFMEIIEQ